MFILSQKYETYRHFNDCIMSIGTTPEKLSQKVAAYADSKPELQRESLQSALVTYLGELCGKPAHAD